MSFLYRVRILRAGSSLLLVLGACGTSDTEPPGDGAEHDASAIHWGYGEEGGPGQWASLSPDFALCQSGLAQSPIDLRTGGQSDSFAAAPGSESASLDLFAGEPGVTLLNNGHTIQASIDGGSRLLLDGTVFNLLQFHFHGPSEHVVDGRHYPMEMHLVHQSADGQLAVVGVLIEEGPHNGALAPLWSAIPEESGESRSLESLSLDLNGLLPSFDRRYRYEGSLTTPPCSEGVHWFVLGNALAVSAEQIEAFNSIIETNNRPVQPLNERVVLAENR